MLLLTMTEEEFKRELAFYDYDYPEELIATSPASPRDSARLMVVSKEGKVKDIATFADIVKFLPKNSLLVFNDTKVVPARLTLKKGSGGRVRVICISINGGIIRVMADRKVSIGEKLISESGYYFIAMGREERYLLVKPFSPSGEELLLDEKLLDELLFKIGETPLPPYIKNSPLSEEDRREEYQSVFAKESGSIAAPTASLHFTDELLARIKAAGHEIVFVTLHVGLGTFAPLTKKNILSGRLHTEKYEISEEAAKKIMDAKKEKRRIIAVGTTSVRTLESSFVDGKVTSGKQETHLFIRLGYEFKIVDGIITNFHIPRSSLLMLVSAFIGKEETISLYSRAIKDNFRLFSFGDGMIIT
ncbi:MAG: tRNA preQ1(34) S-adenosylmethionine ribosyltransferase-isomerase QueA [Candidatus Colwellbacteria bacterium]|nr:tRNA preQ1(34) S-adenosylmethionine ribosyltransferase-isomerase QueA [Candidatus Colwellbacteria bacterium]